MSFEQIDQSYEGLKNFILIDNFTNKCESQLQSFIKERKPKNLEDIVVIMRTYSSAYPNSSFSNKDKKHIDFVGYSKETKSKDIHESRNDRNRDNTDYREIICFNCQGRGHIAAHCKKVNYSRSDNRDSYRKQSRKVELKENRNRNNKSRVYFTNDRDSRESSESEEVEEMNYCWGVEEINFVEDETNRVRVHSGFINGKPMRFVKDSGCSTVGIRSNLVKPDCYLGYEKKVRLIDGSIKRYQACKVFLETPFYTGYCKGLAIPGLSHDLLLGNIHGLKELTQREIDSWNRRHEYKMRQRNSCGKVRRNIICFKCQRKGHIARQCRSWDYSDRRSDHYEYDRHFDSNAYDRQYHRGNPQRRCNSDEYQGTRDNCRSYGPYQRRNREAEYSWRK
ncbi:uncharacterized protein LOC129926418 [Biomphalaria glabrata]|uniref:Uncharacterized protein LOC129926418 n=1 Tax=Biomphalaria glabrata TaxID=6526 RepID=A0A9W3AG80_BIOGL|nr:uncharacterized protein LOC129926418 [Biomphalaria glabrata]